MREVSSIDHQLRSLFCDEVIQVAITKRDEYWYGENHADIRTELTRYSELHHYPIDHFTNVRCECGADIFLFATDEQAGVAERFCPNCEHEHLMGDSSEYVEEAELSQHTCLCDGGQFQLVAGVHCYRESDDSPSNDVRWLYLGARCIACGLVGCFADWKNEYIGFENLLAGM